MDRKNGYRVKQAGVVRQRPTEILLVLENLARPTSQTSKFEAPPVWLQCSTAAPVRRALSPVPHDVKASRKHFHWDEAKVGTRRERRRPPHDGLTSHNHSTRRPTPRKVRKRGVRTTSQSREHARQGEDAQTQSSRPAHHSGRRSAPASVRKKRKECRCDGEGVRDENMKQDADDSSTSPNASSVSLRMRSSNLPQHDPAAAREKPRSAYRPLLHAHGTRYASLLACDVGADTRHRGADSTRVFRSVRTRLQQLREEKDTHPDMRARWASNTGRERLKRVSAEMGRG
ncbi:hypothetical protein C8F04DRAFT_1191110 [Mycena alexandri]|uniref:Uncharacterized protein n=1 Tax=Mycena alexandri TaxID=1745969 RepID=A0AAD6SHY1_9AGAR|nr:hypothetical protein C8F04DRAFT_1191110 [Mycena alexandri]